MPPTHWSTLTITDGEGCDYPPSDCLPQLREYRSAGVMRGYWPCSAAELEAAGGDVDLVGPDADAIDWTDFPHEVP